MPNVEIVSIGSELLLGQIVDTNSAWMAQRLTDLGIDLFHTSVVGDNRSRMADVIGRARSRADVVICGGGLGPTQDDLTREVIANVTGRKLVCDETLLAAIERLFTSRGLRMTANNERQAYIPQGATVLDNPNGTAPAFAVEDEAGVLCALPEVPLELKWLFEHALVPLLRKRYRLAETISYRVLKVVGLGESAIDDKIGELIATSSNPTVGVLAHPGQVDVRITAKAPSAENATTLIEPVEHEIRRLLGKHVFGADEDTLEAAVGVLLRESTLTVASHEDITGGMLAQALSTVSDSGFLEGVVTSVNEKEDDDALAQRQAAELMARCGAGVTVAVHGVPAPGDSRENLRKGKTVVAVAVGNRMTERRFGWAGTSLADRTRTTRYALALLREVLLE